MNLNYMKTLTALLAVTLVSPTVIQPVVKAETNSVNQVSVSSASAPATVSIFISTFQTQDKIYLGWMESEGSTSYILKRNGVQIYEGTKPGFVDTGLTQDTSYTYEVIARNINGDSAPKSVVTKTVPQSLITLPNISNIKVSSTKDTITLDYDMDESIGGLTFIYGIAGELPGYRITNMDLGQTVFDDLEPNKTYSFTAYSSNSATIDSWYLSPGITFTATTKPDGTISPITPVKEIGFVKVWDYLNFRSQPDILSNPVGKLYRNDKVEILSEQGSWYKVKANDKEGYVSKIYVQKFDKTDLDELKSAKTGKVNVQSYLNVRGYPSTISKQVDKLYKDEEVKILTEVNGWYKIEANGKIGYVSKKYIVSQVAPNTQKTVVNVRSFLNVRKGPSTLHPAAGKLYNSNKVTIIQSEGSWYKIKFGNTYGYVSSSYIR